MRFTSLFRSGNVLGFIVTRVWSDHYLPHPLSSLVGETLNESILIVVAAAWKFQELTIQRQKPPKGHCMDGAALTSTFKRR